MGVIKFCQSFFAGITSLIISTEEVGPLQLKNMSSSTEKVVKIGGLSVLKLIFELVSPITSPRPNYEMAEELSKIYGPRIFLKIPFQRGGILILSDLNQSNTLMKAENWPDRIPATHPLHSASFNKPLGLVFGRGEHRRQASRLCSRILQQLDFFRTSKMESFITYEMADILTALESRMAVSGGELVISPSGMFEVATLNIVCQVIAGTRFEHDDLVILNLLHKMNRANREFSIGTSILEFCPSLKHMPSLTFLGSTQGISNEFYNFFKEIIDERKKSNVYQDNSDDFLNVFLQEIQRQAGQEVKYISEEALLVVLRDMVIAGTDTTNCALEHAILQMSLNPRVQEKVQLEIDEFIGSSRGPNYFDKDRMVYTQAVLLEILRLTSPVPVTARTSDEDTIWDGHIIPKGSLAVINIYAIHRSETLWKDPSVFRPERFLSEDGKIINTEKIMPYGYGKRMCIGKTLAHCSFFIFFVSIFQKFSTRMSDHHPPPSMRNSSGLSRCPSPYHVKIIRRA